MRHLLAGVPNVATASGFEPTDVAGLGIWLDASDTATITDAGAGAVSQWNDKSGNGRHVAQSTSGSRPTTGTNTLNSLNVITFDGSADHLFYSGWAAANNNYLVFVVAYTAVTGTDKFICSHRSSTSGNPIIGTIGKSNSDRGLDHRNDSGTLTRIGATTWASGTAKLLVGYKNGATMRLYDGGGTDIANTSGASTGATTVNRFGVGAQLASGTPSTYWNGRIAEIVYYDGVNPSSADANSVGSYLATKWGLSWSNVTF